MMARRPDYFVRPAVLLLVCLADGIPRHGYGLAEEIIGLTGTRPADSTVGDALLQLERDGLVEAVPTSGRRKPYQITEAGRDELDYALALLNRLARAGRAAMQEWREATGRTGDVPSRSRRRADAELPADLEAAVLRQATADGVSRSDIVRNALAREVQGHGTCPTCGTRQRLTKAGRVVAHPDRRSGERCDGRGQLPLATPRERSAPPVDTAADR